MDCAGRWLASYGQNQQVLLEQLTLSYSAVKDGSNFSNALIRNALPSVKITVETFQNGKTHFCKICAYN
jgi:hypothetical protein